VAHLPVGPGFYTTRWDVNFTTPGPIRAAVLLAPLVDSGDALLDLFRWGRAHSASEAA